MNVTHRSPEPVVRHAPFGARFWDIAGAAYEDGRLEVNVLARPPAQRKTRAFVTRSGVYCTLGVAGLRSFETDEGENPWTATVPRRHRVEVRDPVGRFLPIAFDADLPSRGLFEWRTPWTSPPRSLVLPMDRVSPPREMKDRVPLFSACTRPVPEQLAVVRAELREFGTEKPVAWALITASVDGVARGIGLTDTKGRVAILFPYPERARASLASPPPARNDFAWNVRLDAYYEPLTSSPPISNAPISEFGDLDRVIKQLDTPPRMLLSSIQSPLQPLPELPLEYRVPLTARTQITESLQSPYLYVNPV